MMFRAISALGLVCVLAGNAAAQDMSLYATPQALPPDLPWKGASEKLIAPANDPWITPSEITGLTATPSYDETLAYLRKLAAASPLIRLQVFGKTAQGRDLYVVIASKDDPGAADPKLDPAKPVILAQAGIHSGEIDGKDAGLMLLRDMAFKGKDGLLDKANFLLVPFFNADGHERTSEFNRPNQRGPVSQGWRTTSQNLNLNRDYVKAEAPEMQAMIALIRRVDPDLYLDLHVTDGLDYQYDITYGFGGRDKGWAASPTIGAWLSSVYQRDVDRALKAGGHEPGPLIFEVNPQKPEEGLTADALSPRYSHAYGDMIHIPAVLVENHSLKNYRRRVLGTYVLLEQSLKTLGREAKTVEAAKAKDRAARPAQLQAGWAPSKTATGTTKFLAVAHEAWNSPASGREEVRWLGKALPLMDVPIYAAVSAVTLQRPVAYWVPATKADVIKKLQTHGVQIETLSAPRTVSVEVQRLPDLKPDAAPFEGRFRMTAGSASPEKRAVTFPIGSVRVPTDQPLGELIMMMMEPASEDSFLAWGYFPEILQRTEYIEGYVMAPMAERMLAADPALKAEFEAKLASDPTFAADGDARLSWFYMRTPYFDDAYLLYPVGIER